MVNSCVVRVPFLTSSKKFPITLQEITEVDRACSNVTNSVQYNNYNYASSKGSVPSKEFHASGKKPEVVLLCSKQPTYTDITESPVPP